MGSKAERLIVWLLAWALVLWSMISVGDTNTHAQAANRLRYRRIRRRRDDGPL